MRRQLRVNLQAPTRAAELTEGTDAKGQARISISYGRISELSAVTQQTALSAVAQAAQPAPLFHVERSP